MAHRRHPGRRRSRRGCGGGSDLGRGPGPPPARPAGGTRRATPAAAERARPARRPIPARPLFLGSRFYRPYPYFGYYGAFFGPYAGPYAGAYAGPYGYGPYAFQYYGAYDYTGSVRLEVEPRETEVYVDGYYTGIVDSYDGFLQRPAPASRRARHRALPGGL